MGQAYLDCRPLLRALGCGSRQVSAEDGHPPDRDQSKSHLLLHHGESGYAMVMLFRRVSIVFERLHG